MKNYKRNCQIADNKKETDNDELSELQQYIKKSTQQKNVLKKILVRLNNSVQKNESKPD